MATMAITIHSPPPGVEMALSLKGNDLKTHPVWTQMQNAMEAEKKATWQQILAVHTSTCCTPKRLEPACLRNPLTDPGSGKTAVTLTILGMHDGLVDWTCTSEWHDSHAEAKEAACFDTLCSLLLLGPHLVSLHPNSLRNHHSSVRKLRAVASSGRLPGLAILGVQEVLAALPAVRELAGAIQPWLHSLL